MNLEPNLNIRADLTVHGVTNKASSQEQVSQVLPGFDEWSIWEWSLFVVWPSNPATGLPGTTEAELGPLPWGWWSVHGRWDTGIGPCRGRMWPQSDPGIAGTPCENRAAIWANAHRHRTYLELEMKTISNERHPGALVGRGSSSTLWWEVPRGLHVTWTPGQIVWKQRRSCHPGGSLQRTSWGGRALNNNVAWSIYRRLVGDEDEQCESKVK